MKLLLSRKKKVVLLAAIMGSLMGYGTASAANLAVAVPSDYSASQMGAVTGSRVTTKVDKDLTRGAVTDLNRDPATFAVNINGETKIFTRQYGYSTSVTVPNILFDAENLNKDSSPQGPIDAVPNAHAAAGYGDLLFAAGYDLGKIGVAQIQDNAIIQKADKAIDLKSEIVQKAHIQLGDKATVHGEGVSVSGNQLFALASITPEGDYTSYEDGVLLQYDIGNDGSLQYAGYTRVGKNTDAPRMNWYNGNAVISAIGGMQNYGDTSNGKESYITVADTVSGQLDPSSRKIIHMPESMEDGNDFRDVKVLPNGTVYIMKYNLTGASGANESGFRGGVYKTTMANLLADKPKNWEKIIDGSVASNGGWFGKIDAEYYTKRFWVEWGNQLLVYTDGDKNPTYRWNAADFSTNEQYYQFNSVTMLPTDTIFGDLAQLSAYKSEGLTSVSETVNKIVNANASNKVATRTVQITGSKADEEAYGDATSDYGKYTFHKDETISLGKSAEGNYDNNILAAVFAYDGSDVDIDASGHTLNLEASNLIATPVGIYAGSGRNVSIKANQVNVITSGLDASYGGNSLTNAIWADGGSKDRSKIQIDGNVAISMSGGYGGNGIAVQKTDRWGENSQTAAAETSVVINGDVSIAGADNTEWGIPANRENVYSRFNNAGILTNIEKGKVIVNGNVDFSVYGNGITTNAKDSSVSIGGGHITVPKGMKYGYYTLGAYQGTINVNAGTDGQTPGKNDVQLDGDIFALSTGTVNAALTTKSSYLRGIIDNGGDVNLWLQNGASWINTANNTRYKEDNEDVGNDRKSRVTYFHGGDSADKAGVIFQEKNSDTLTIDNYSGYTTVIYGHDAKDPATIIGGNVTIGTAAEGSAITLRTDSEGLNAASSNYKDRNLVSETLNALAGKLYYTGWTKQEKNLSGKVEIAEGLTSQSAALRTETISYQDNGQGQYEYTPEVPDIQTKTEFTTSITGGEDSEYKDSGVLREGKYVFSADQTTINTEKHLIAGGPWLTQISNAISGADAEHSVVIDMKGNRLDIQTISDTHTTGIAAIGEGKVEINNAGAMSVRAESTGKGQTAALFANGGGTILIHNGGEDLENKVLTIRADTTHAANGALVKTMNGKNGVESRIVIDGLVDVLADGDMSDGKGANEALSAVASTIEVGGGSIKAINGAKYAIRAYGEFVSKNSGVVNVNVLKDKEGNIIGAGANKTIVEGDIATTGGMGTKGRISVGLSTKDSYWHGDYKENTGYGVTPGQLGNVNVFLSNGADWTGYSTGTMAVDMDSGSTWHGYNTSDNFVLNLRNGAAWYNTNTTDTISKLSYLIGGSDEAGAGVINMTADGTQDVSIGNYSGYTTVIYGHDAKDPATIIGGNVTIGTAAEGSSISLVTDSEGIAMNNEFSINDALDALAHKLTYGAYTSGERNLTGYVKIAEGLTANSAVKQTGNIAFNDTTGQGSLAEGTVTPGAEYPESQGTDTFSSAITGDEKTDILYKQAGVLKKGIYTFTKNPTKITVDKGAAVDASKDVTIAAGDQRLYLKGAENGIYAGTGTTVNISAAELHAEGGLGIQASGTVNVTGIAYITGNDGTAISASADGRVSLNTGKIEGDVVSNGGTVTINQAQSGNEVVVNGDVISENGGFIDLSLLGRTSSLTGGVTTETGDVTLRLKKGAVWNYNSDIDTTISLDDQAAQPKGTFTLEGGATESEAGRIRYTGSENLQIGDYSGHIIVEYDHKGDGSKVSDYKAGDIHISSAKDNSSMTLLTDSEGIDMSSKEKVGTTLNTLASKLWYEGGNGALEASAKIAEGMTASSAGWTGKIDYTEQGQGTLKQGSLAQIVKDPEIIYGPKETAMMRGAKSAMTTSMLSWRNTMADMMSRMGDLRFSGETDGIWGRTYGGRVSYDKSNTSVENNFWGAQVGADRTLASGWHTGIAFDYNDGDSSYELGGEGDPKLYMLSLYGTKLFNDGQYLDLVVKAGRTENEYTVYNDMRHQLKGDYHANGYGISVEYGKRFGSAKGYIEPQIQLTLSRLEGTDYDAVSDYGGGKKMHVSQDGMNSFIGRLGIAAGKSSERGDLYVKASLAHEFAGSTSSTYSAENEPTSSVDQDFKDTWAELALGGNYKLNDNSMMYGELTKSFGGDYELEWKANLGIRFRF